MFLNIKGFRHYKNNTTVLVLLQCCTHSLDEASPDLWTLGIQGNANRPVLDAAWFEAFTRFTYVLDGLCMVLQSEIDM